MSILKIIKSYKNMKIKHKKEATIIFMVASGLGRVSFLFYYVVIRALNKGSELPKPKGVGLPGQSA